MNLLLTMLLTLTTQAALSTGSLLPELRGEFLTGREAVLPAAASGKIALLALGFTYDSRFPVEAWSKAFRESFTNESDVTFFEIPMIGGMARLGKFFINRGMRSGTPEQLHENVITVYGGTGPWKERVGYRDGKAAYLILLDRSGRIRWMHSGRFESTAFNELVRMTRELRQSATTPEQGTSSAESSR